MDKIDREETQDEGDVYLEEDENHVTEFVGETAEIRPVSGELQDEKGEDHDVDFQISNDGVPSGIASRLTESLGSANVPSPASSQNTEGASPLSSSLKASTRADFKNIPVEMDLGLHASSGSLDLQSSQSKTGLTSYDLYERTASKSVSVLPPQSLIENFTFPTNPPRRLRSNFSTHFEEADDLRTVTTTPGAVAIPGLRVSELNSYDDQRWSREAIPGPTIVSRHISLGDGQPSHVPQDAGGPQRRHTVSGTAAMHVFHAQLVASNDENDEEYAGTSRSELGLHQSRESSGVLNTETRIQNQEITFEQAEEALKVKIEPDPVKFFCHVFRGRNCFTRRVPLLYVITAFISWMIVFVITIEVVIEQEETKIAENIANNLLGYSSTESSLGAIDLSRIDSIAKVLEPAVSSPLVFSQSFTEESKALRWLAYEDPLELHISDTEALIQRFTARVLFEIMFDEAKLREEEGLILDPSKHECEWTLRSNDSNIREKSFGDELFIKAAYSTSNVSDSKLGDHVILNLTTSSSTVENPNVKNISSSSGENILMAQNEHTFDIYDFVSSDLIRGGLWHDSKGPPPGRDLPQSQLGFKCNQKKEIVEIFVSGAFIAASLPYGLGGLSSLSSLSIVKASYAVSNHPSYRPPSLMPPLKRLPNLTDLVLDLDDFSSIEGISDLRQLIRLELFRGGRYKSFPTEIGSLWNLRHLHFHDLSIKPFEPLIPDRVLDNLNSLESLVVHRCNGNYESGDSDDFKGPAVFELSDYIQNFYNLKNLSITECQNVVNGSIPFRIGELSNLVRLELPGIVRNSTIPLSLFNLTKLTYLDLSENKFMGAIPYDQFESLFSLETLVLSQNSYSGSFPSELMHLKELQHLDLSFNNLYGSIPTLNERSKLKTLLLHQNNLTNKAFQPFCNCSQLETLSLSRNNFTEWDADCPTSFKNLHYLYLAENKISSPFPPIVLEMTQLRTIQLSSSGIVGAIPSEIGYLRNLVVLDMASNSLTGTIPAELGSLPDLHVLRMDDNQLQGGLPITLCNAARLNVLSLAGNDLHHRIPSCIGEVQTMMSLDLSYNMFEGPLSSEIGTLFNLLYLNLEGNLLSSTIPSEIGDLVNLQSLNLASNDFVGSIPETFGNLASLISLDLHGNALSGDVPLSFSSLTSLKQMDLTRNNVTGDLTNMCANWDMDDFPIDDIPSQNNPSTSKSRLHRNLELYESPQDREVSQFGRTPMYFRVESSVTCGCCRNPPWCRDSICDSSEDGWWYPEDEVYKNFTAHSDMDLKPRTRIRHGNRNR